MTHENPANPVASGMQTRPRRLILAEDHPMTRMGLRLMLDNNPDYCLVAEAKNGQEALDAVAEYHPDLVLMDIGMPEMDGIEATQRLKQQHPQLPVLMLTSKDDPIEVRAAIAAGANGYCLKGLEWEQLKAAIDAVADGNAWLDRQIARVVLAELQQPTLVTSTMASATLLQQAAEKAEAVKPSPLTDREMEVLGLIVEGLSNNDISDRLYISIATTKAHVHSILQKLCLDDRTQAAVWAMRNGYVK